MGRSQPAVAVVARRRPCYTCVMSTDVQELLNTALRLPERDRAELAASLMESLDEAFDTGAQADRRPVIIPSQTLEPRPCAMVRQILAVVQKEDGVFVASFVDANINGSGESQLDAVEMLKDMVASTFRLLSKKEDVLGEAAQRQLAVLRQFIQAR